jgi:Leucine-rich repeat (LRR) protein
MAKKKSVDALIREAKERRQKFLLLSDLGLTELPESVCELAQLERLEASRNQLKALPKNLTNLVQLHELELNRNEIKRPWDVCAVDSLRELGLADNRISEISPQISQLQRLRSLDLGFNQIKRLPEELGALPELVSLDLSGNQLKSIPAAVLREMANLTQLFLSGNTAMPIVPAHIFDHPSLAELHLDAEQYRNVPQAVIERGRPSVHI